MHRKDMKKWHVTANKKSRSQNDFSSINTINRQRITNSTAFLLKKERKSKKDSTPDFNQSLHEEFVYTDVVYPQSSNHANTTTITMGLLTIGCLLACLGGADAKELNMSPAMIENELKNICTQVPFQIPNKPEGRYDKFMGRSQPTECAALKRKEPGTSQQKCDEVTRIWDRFFGKPVIGVPAKLQEKREQYKNKIKIHDEVTKFRKKNTLTSEQENVFQQYVSLLEKLEESKVISEYAQEINLGNCYEVQQHTLYQLFQKSLGSLVGVQLAEVWEGEVSHGFTLLNSTIPDVRIIKDNYATTQYLKGIKSGKICDAWNSGLYTDAATNTNEYYRSGWSTVIIKSVPFNIDPSVLPKKVILFLNNQFRRLGLKQSYIKTREQKNEDVKLDNVKLEL